MHGQDLAARYQSDVAADPARQTVLAETDFEGNVVKALRGMDWKFIEANEGNPRGLPPEQLFEISVDPKEKTDLHQQQREITDRMRSDTNAEVELARSRAVQGGKDATLTEADRERLRALGYIK
jgi:hypothetical protein